MTTPQMPAVGTMAGVDALVTDRYLDGLLAAAERGASATPADIALDAELRAASDLLRRSLVRVHPSFRFEERLAARLADMAEVRGAALRAAPAAVIAFPGRPHARGDATTPAAGVADPLLAAVLDGVVDPADAADVARAEGVRFAPRPLLLGGAITSAAISLVGVALVAWRAGHAADRGRSDSALAPTGAGGPA